MASDGMIDENLDNVIIYCDEDSSVFTLDKVKEMVEMLQKFLDSDLESELNMQRDTVAGILELLSIDLPPVWEEEEEESWCTDDSETSSSDSENEDVEDDSSSHDHEVIFDDNLELQNCQNSDNCQRTEEAVDAVVIPEQTLDSSSFNITVDGSQERTSLNLQSYSPDEININTINTSEDIKATEESLITREVSQITITPVTGASTASKIQNSDDENLSEDNLWSFFVDCHKSGAVIDVQEAEDEEDFIVEYIESSEESESDWSSDEDDERSSSDQFATFPYMNSDSESEDPILDPKATESVSTSLLYENEVDVIVLDEDEEDLVNDLKESEMICIRCSVGKGKFTDKDFFLMHCKRHLGNNHFVCPTCLKPFTKASFCLAHEVRAHNEKFNYAHNLITKANSYVKERDAKIALWESKIGEVELDEEFFDQFEDETDEDDPKFYPNHAVPSTSLYPYRGPKLDSHCESYEVQLKFGRKKRTGVNTICRIFLARRQELKDAGRIPAEGNRFWKPPTEKVLAASRQKKKSGSDSSDFVPRQTENKRKRPRLLSASDPEGDVQEINLPPRKRRKKKLTTQNSKKEKMLNRTFVSSFICHICQLCNYVWKTEEDLRIHRDEKHPAKLVMELMTMQKSQVEDDLFYEIERPKKRKKNPRSSSVEKKIGSLRLKMSKEAFLLNLGLISAKKLTLRRLKSRLTKKDTSYVKMEKLDETNIPRSGRVFLCNVCSYYTKSRDLINLHKKGAHNLKIQQPKTKTKIKISRVRKSNTKPKKKSEIQLPEKIVGIEIITL